jgi:hypothetical protein
MKNRDRTTDDQHRRRREAGDEDDRDGKEVASALYGGAPGQKGRGYYGCDLDGEGHCRRAGTEHCDWNCPHPSTPTDEPTDAE